MVEGNSSAQGAFLERIEEITRSAMNCFNITLFSQILRCDRTLAQQGKELVPSGAAQSAGGIPARTGFILAQVAKHIVIAIGDIAERGRGCVNGGVDIACGRLALCGPALIDQREKPGIERSDRAGATKDVLFASDDYLVAGGWISIS